MNVIQDVIELEVFNEEGQLVTKIETVKNVRLHWSTEGGNSYLTVTDALVNFKMIEQLGEVQLDRLSDFDKRMSTTGGSKTIVFNQKPKKSKFKLIGRGITYSIETANVNYDFEIIIPEVELSNEYKFYSEQGEVHAPHYTFKIKPFNEEEDLFKVVLHERKQ